MKILGLQFTDKQDLQLSDIAESTGFSRAKVARAAMQIGLQMIKSHSEDVCNSGFSREEYIAINELKARH